MNSRSDESIIIDFAHNLKKIREKKGISIRELADLAGLSFGNLGEIELGKRNPLLTTVIRLAEALKVTTEDLTGQ